MDVSVEEDNEIWINKAFCIPSLPESSKGHYPFSRDPALVYRLKLAVVFLNAAVALWWVGEPCLRLSLLLNCWLLFATCEEVYRNYPWREPLTAYLWKFYWSVPFSKLWLFLCSVLLLNLGAGCELAHPLAAVTVGWLCCMVSWPRIREDSHREGRCEEDYDQFSCSRSHVWKQSGSFRMIFAALHSPSLFAFAVIALAALCVRGWITAVCVSGCLSVLCCHSLPADVARTLAAWETQEASYARKIENYLRMIKGHLRTSGIPREDSTQFHRLSIQVPLLLRETEILRKASVTVPDNRIEELDKLATGTEMMEFREILDDYGPYTTECCIF